MRPGEFKRWLVLLPLLFGLMSYSIDADCLLESHSCSASAELGSVCAQPGVIRASVALLAPSPPAIAAPTLALDYVSSTPPRQASPKVDSRVFVPLGLRAPPLA